MIEIERYLSNIKMKEFIKSINNTHIGEKLFFPFLKNTEEKIACDKLLMNDNNTYLIIKYTGLIEWTPVLLCQSIYFMVRYNDEFWTIKYDKTNGLVAKYYMNVYNMLLSIIYNNNNILDCKNITYPNLNEINNSIFEMVSNKTKYIKISAIKDYSNTIKYIHYIILYSNIIYYIIHTDSKSTFFIYPYY